MQGIMVLAAAPNWPDRRRLIAPSAAIFARHFFPSDHPIVQVMDEMPGWRRLVDTAAIVIHVREEQPSR